MKFLFTTLILCSLASCSTSTSSAQNETNQSEKIEEAQLSLSEVDEHFHENDTVQSPSMSIGSVGNGKLKNGRIVPFSGDNFHYFDTTSYLANRGFTHETVLKTVLETYDALDSLLPGRHFCIMECSHQHGGKLMPHRTHQNGLSVDFMMPKLKDSQPYYGLDDLGAEHYMLTFDENGKYVKDPSIELDFNTIALHILELQSAAKKNGMSIEKVIIKTELKDELYGTKHGKTLKQSGIYITRNLSPLINALHDEHFHVDFRME
ncbi:MAG: penicillin-insensitive murein endopeptidase [Crocinitomicaceae bacterium]